MYAVKINANQNGLVSIEQVDWSTSSGLKQIQQAVNANNVDVIALRQSKIGQRGIDLWMDDEALFSAQISVWRLIWYGVEVRTAVGNSFLVLAVDAEGASHGLSKATLQEVLVNLRLEPWEG
ncbi:hypothetical protein ESZ50_07365 [Weissella muntiaci]|uniref:Uncharacterized protein n=1 Tax=Weissella muntiaci TaxID=2508881 RepID=A0A6C2C626_9LACO|nr:hypothetical protein [Weissella muntiaci]TYC49056.1 hypothetical protein ESZ50_07365 [Weissella muntiaci]